MERKSKAIETFLVFAEDHLDGFLGHDCEDYGLSEEEFEIKKTELVKGFLAIRKIYDRVKQQEDQLVELIGKI